MKHIDHLLDILRNAGEHFVEYNYPLGSPLNEQDIGLFKQGKTTVDGYEVNVHYNKSDYGEYLLETFQIFGYNIPFLPFNVVIKTAQRALGKEHLLFVEYYRGEQKTYCWSVMTDRNGNPIPYKTSEKSQSCSYEGFEYTKLDSQELSYH
jgi:hypothetical protein